MTQKIISELIINIQQVVYNLLKYFQIRQYLILIRLFLTV